MNDIVHGHMVQDLLQHRFGSHQKLICKYSLKYPAQAEREFQRLTNSYIRIVNQLLKEYLPEIRDAAQAELNPTSRHDDDSDLIATVKRVFSKMSVELPAQAVQWGADIIDGIVSGITSAVGKIGKAASNVASKIRSFLGFSEPEDGPLSDFHTYMPDMIDLMVKGIAAGKRKVSDALKGITGEMSLTVKSATQLKEPENDNPRSPAKPASPTPDEPKPATPVVQRQIVEHQSEPTTVQVSWPEERKAEAVPKPDTGIREVLSGLADLAVKGIAAGKRKVSDALRDIIGRLSGPEPADTGEENNEGNFPEFPPFPSINFPDWPKQPEPTPINWPEDSRKSTHPQSQNISLVGIVSGIVGGVAKAVAAGKRSVAENPESGAYLQTALSGIRAIVGNTPTTEKTSSVLPGTAKNITNSTNTVRKSIVQNVNINNQFNGDRAGQQKSSKAMDKAAADTTGELARALAFAK